MAENLYTPHSIRTVSGRYVNLVEMDPESLDIRDVAYALSQIPRFGGHLPRRYSVAQHSIDVCRRVAHLGREVRLQALLHDASEALLGDLPSPVKALLPDYRALEQRVMETMSRRFGFPWPLLPEVKHADRMALEDEWRVLMLGNPNERRLLLTDAYPQHRFVELYRELTA